MRAVLVTLLVLCGLLVAADRGGAWLAQRIAASQIQQHEHLSTRPQVTVHGVPFLTQFASGHYRHVTVRIADYSTGTGARRVDLSDVRVDLRGLDASRNFSTLTAAEATASGVVDYASLSRLLNATVADAGSGRVSASRTISVAGLSVTGTVSAVPVVTADTLSFRDIRVSVGGAGLPSAAISAFTAVFGDSVALPQLPFGVSLASVAAESSGLRVGLSGADVTYSG